jgi:hypothetical protein
MSSLHEWLDKKEAGTIYLLPRSRALLLERLRQFALAQEDKTPRSEIDWHHAFTDWSSARVAQQRKRLREELTC